MQDWTPQNLQQELARSNDVFLKLWKKGCGACKLSTPAIERIEAADQHGLKFGQINVDDHPELLELADTEVLPAFLIFKNKKVAGKFVGFKGLAKLQAMVDETLRGES